MAKVLVFVGFMVALVVTMNFVDFRGQKVSNERFDFEKTKVANAKKAEELKKLMEPKVEKKVEVVEVPEGPLVELNTDQLVSGDALYKKCIVCHGKTGQGKSSQNAPAIGGQHDWYLADQIKNMRDGKRINQIMMPYIKNLSDQDIQDLAAYISKLPYMGQK